MNNETRGLVNKTVSSINIMMKHILLIFTLSLTGCVKTIDFPVSNSLSHDEIVKRLKQLFMKESVIISRLLSSSNGIELSFGKGIDNKISKTKTYVRYSHLTPQPSPSLHTPSQTYVWTIVDIDTSKKNIVQISVKSYRHGNFIDSRLREMETYILNNLKVLKQKANKQLYMDFGADDAPPPVN